MTVTLKVRDDIAVLQIDDGKRNVVNHEVLAELEELWAEAEQNASAIVLKGREGCFCAGYDIRVMTGGDREASARLGKRGGRMAERIYSCPKPVVGLTQGHCFTIGLVWLAGCDVRIAEQGDFRLGMTEVALGVTLSGWALEAMRDRVRPVHRIAALQHSTQYLPEGALEAGFVDEVVASGDGFEAALAKAKALAELPAEAYGQTKLALRDSMLQAMRAGL
ncbi:MAG: crotonase/enoyl-CoA hydratase family protein [Acidobacteriota bacterium]